MPTPKPNAWTTNVDKESVEKGKEIPITFNLPGIDDEPIEYKILDEPFEIETPNAPFGNKMTKMKVSVAETEGEIILSNSLMRNMAIALERLGFDYETEPLTGKHITVWTVADKNKKGYQYHHCSIR